MFIARRTAILVLACVLTLSACGDRKSASGSAPADKAAAGGKALNLYIWSDYLAANTLSDFEKQTGIKVHVAYFDTNETLETKLLAGSSGYDVVVPTASYFERQIKAGVYLTLDKSKLPNLKNMDPQLMAKVALHDPDNAHGIIYTWGTNGIGYNEKMVRALMPDAPLDSWRLVFDPAVASQVAKCGISVLDSPAEMMRAVYSYLGKDPNSQSPDDLALAEGTLTKIRPYIRNINSSEYIEALANGDLCIAVGYNGDVMQARDRAREANKDHPRHRPSPPFIHRFRSSVNRLIRTVNRRGEAQAPPALDGYRRCRNRGAAAMTSVAIIPPAPISVGEREQFAQTPDSSVL